LFFVEIDRLNNVYVLGQSMGGQFPIINATGNPNSGQFIAKINPSLTSILNATTFGNSNSSINISPSAFLVDICGNIYVSGWGANILQSTPLSGMPVSANAFQQNPANGFDFYLGVFKSDFSGLLYGTYLGGALASEHVDGGTSRFDKNGVVYQSVCGGCGGHSDFPTTMNAWSQQNLSSNCNNLVFKFDFDLIPDAQFTASSIQGCEDFTVQFNNTSASANDYLWDFGNGDTTSVIFSPTITYTEPGIYEATLLVTDSVCLLTDTAKTFITVLPSVQLFMPNDTVLCAQNTIALNAQTFGSATQFIWSSNVQFSDTLNNSITDSLFTATVTSSTTFYLHASNGFCSVVDSVTIFYVAGSLEITGNDSICVQQTTTLSVSIAIPNVTFQYTWTPANLITPTTNPAIVTANPTNDAWIYCIATGSNGCVAKDSILIHVGSINGIVTATANPGFITLGNSSSLTVTPAGYSYVWTPANTLNTSTNNNVTATPTENTTYTVSVTDGICVQTDTVSVKVVQFICDRAWVYVPNAFTPNGDGKNDVLFVRSEITEDLLFRVYNRWGELVFETRDISKGWDGKFKGKLIDPDTYDYYLEVTCAGGEQQIIKGNTTLIR
jgi:gliding motility-associated-like protein